MMNWEEADSLASFINENEPNFDASVQWNDKLFGHYVTRQATGAAPGRAYDTQNRYIRDRLVDAPDVAEKLYMRNLTELEMVFVDLPDDVLTPGEYAIGLIEIWGRAKINADINPKLLLKNRSASEYPWAGSVCAAHMSAVNGAQVALLFLTGVPNIPQVLRCYISTRIEGACGSCWLSGNLNEMHPECIEMIAQYFYAEKALLEYAEKLIDPTIAPEPERWLWKNRRALSASAHSLSTMCTE